MKNLKTCGRAEYSPRSLPVFIFRHVDEFIWSCFVDRAALLTGLFEATYKKAEWRTKRSIANISYRGLGWNMLHATAIRELRDQLLHAIKLSHRDLSLQLYVYTDASNANLSSVITQCAEQKLRKPTTSHHPLPHAFLNLPLGSSQGNGHLMKKRSMQLYKPSGERTTFSPILIVSQFLQTTTIFYLHFTPQLLNRHLVNTKLWKLFTWHFNYQLSHTPSNTSPVK